MRLDCRGRIPLASHFRPRRRWAGSRLRGHENRPLGRGACFAVLLSVLQSWSRYVFLSRGDAVRAVRWLAHAAWRIVTNRIGTLCLALVRALARTEPYPVHHVKLDLHWSTSSVGSRSAWSSSSARSRPGRGHGIGGHSGWSFPFPPFPRTPPGFVSVPVVSTLGRGVKWGERAVRSARSVL